MRNLPKALLSLLLMLPVSDASAFVATHRSKGGLEFGYTQNAWTCEWQVRNRTKADKCFRVTSSYGDSGWQHIPPTKVNLPWEWSYSSWRVEHEGSCVTTPTDFDFSARDYPESGDCETYWAEGKAIPVKPSELSREIERIERIDAPEGQAGWRLGVEIMIAKPDPVKSWERDRGNIFLAVNKVPEPRCYRLLMLDHAEERLVADTKWVDIAGQEKNQSPPFGSQAIQVAKDSDKYAVRMLALKLPPHGACEAYNGLVEYQKKHWVYSRSELAKLWGVNDFGDEQIEDIKGGPRPDAGRPVPIAESLQPRQQAGSPELDRGLLEAASKGAVAAVRALVDSGADVNAVDEHGQTPLIIAARSGNVEIVEALLARKADASKKDREGRSAQELARANGHAGIANLIAAAEGTTDSGNRVQQDRTENSLSPRWENFSLAWGESLDAFKLRLPAAREFFGGWTIPDKMTFFDLTGMPIFYFDKNKRFDKLMLVVDEAERPHIQEMLKKHLGMPISSGSLVGWKSGRFVVLNSDGFDCSRCTLIILKP